MSHRKDYRIWRKRMGKFHLVYYISMGTPSIEASLQMAETYLAHGVSALQFALHPQAYDKGVGDLRRL